MEIIEQKLNQSKRKNFEQIQKRSLPVDRKRRAIYGSCTAPCTENVMGLRSYGSTTQENQTLKKSG